MGTSLPVNAARDFGTVLGKEISIVNLRVSLHACDAESMNAGRAVTKPVLFHLRKGSVATRTRTSIMAG